MNPKNKWNLIGLAILLLAIGVACSGDTSKANTFVDEANKLIDEAKTLSDVAEKKNNEVFDKMTPDYPADRDTLKSTAQEAVDAFDKASKKLKEASGKFDDAGKLKVDDKFKEYLTTKASEMGKRSDWMSAMKENSQAFLDSKDLDELKARLTASKLKTAGLDQDAKELGDKAKKIQEDNKEIFKKDAK